MPLTRNNLIQIGHLMCLATQEVLWKPATIRTAADTLVCRVGPGQATYHRYEPREEIHLINYGIRMIAAKHGPESAQGWLSTREIQGRGYFGGELSALNLLAHTCCHEFAHLLQHGAGQRIRGSVHNRAFYRILDQLHENGRAEATRDYLWEKARSRSVALSDQPFDLPDPVEHARQWQKGEQVAFGHGASRKQGQIIRVNRKTCTVQGAGPQSHIRYRVPFSLLHRLAH